MELGTFSKNLHEEIGKVLLNSDLDYIITIGNETKYTDEYLKNNNYDNLKHFNNENESYGYIDDLLKDGDLVLFKGSHGMHLSNIIKYLVDNQKIAIHSCITIFFRNKNRRIFYSSIFIFLVIVLVILLYVAE